MAKNIYGKCRLCGKENVKLTFEHYPPAKALNSTKVHKIIEEDWLIKMMTLPDDVMPWETDMLKKKQIQQGNGDYILCSDCNSKLGAWYMDEYVKFARGVHSIIADKTDKIQSMYIEYRMYPLRFIKAVVALFNDIGSPLISDNMREWLLDKERNDIEPGYSIHMNIIKNGVIKTLPFITMGIKGECVKLSEFSYYPFNFILVKDKPNNIYIPGLDITGFVKSKYDEEKIIHMDFLQIHEINSVMACDFRTKDEIIKDRQRNIELRNKHN